MSFYFFLEAKGPTHRDGQQREEKLLLHPGSGTGWWTIRLDLNITLILRPSVTPPRTQQRFLLHHKHRAKDGQIAKRRTHQLRSMESQTGWWRGEGTIGARRAREEGISESREVGEQRGRTDLQQGHWRMSTGIEMDSQSAARENRRPFYRPFICSGSNIHTTLELVSRVFFQCYLVIWNPELIFYVHLPSRRVCFSISIAFYSGLKSKMQMTHNYVTVCHQPSPVQNTYWFRNRCKSIIYRISE